MPSGISYLYKGTEESKEHGEFTYDTIFSVINWGRDKGLNDPKSQGDK